MIFAKFRIFNFSFSSSAQDLLNQWVTEKVNLDDGLEYDNFEEESWHTKPSKAEIKREWDNMVDLEDYGYVPDVPKTSSHKTPSAGMLFF